MIARPGWKRTISSEVRCLEFSEGDSECVAVGSVGVGASTGGGDGRDEPDAVGVVLSM
jgi:hypothetical protein